MATTEWTTESDIPDNRYFTISEACALCGVKAHVLRYWEQEFPTLTPIKRRGRRYYRKKDVELIREIYRLLYKERFTIPGARERLRVRTVDLDQLRKGLEEIRALCKLDESL